MPDTVKSYIYATDIRLKLVSADSVTKCIANSQNIKNEEGLITPSVLFSAFYASEQKNDDGSAYISYKYPEPGCSFTAICETDGRLRGYKEEYTPSEINKQAILLTAGIKLLSRGDYQSAVTGGNTEDAANVFLKSSSQTLARIKFLETAGKKVLIFAEYVPGHSNDENSPDIIKITEKILNAICFATENSDEMLSCEKDIPELKLKYMGSFPIVFGCTCSKRKIKNALVSSHSEELEFPLEITCKFCGKKYIITES